MVGTNTQSYLKSIIILVVIFALVYLFINSLENLICYINTYMENLQQRTEQMQHSASSAKKFLSEYKESPLTINEIYKFDNENKSKLSQKIKEYLYLKNIPFEQFLKYPANQQKQIIRPALQEDNSCGSQILKDKLIRNIFTDRLSQALMVTFIGLFFLRLVSILPKYLCNIFFMSSDN